MALSLGFNLGHDQGAALVQDGKVARAISLERLDRRKHSSGVTIPHAAIEYCFEALDISWRDLDVVVYNYPHHDRAYPVIGQVEEALGRLCRTHSFVSHHLAHAYATFYASPFREANVLVADGAGNRCDERLRDQYTCLGWDLDGQPGDIEAESGYFFSETDREVLFKRWQTRSGDPQNLSLGRMYWETCRHVGFGHLDGGKLMGLSSFGDPRCKVVSPPVRGFDFFLGLDFIQKMPRDSFQEKADAAYVVQKTLEQVLLELVAHLCRRNPCTNLCLGGGIALNAVTNEKILRHTPVEKLFVVPACDDSGIALGCAYYGYHALLGGSERHPFAPYTGRTYRGDILCRAVNRYEIRHHDDIALETARLLAAGKIVGWFQGASEHGPRALGNRSILCDPRRAEMKHILNERVKHREWYRPFAPAILEEEAKFYFDLPCESPYMLIISEGKRERAGEVAAVMHVDGTARVQTVAREQNGPFHRLLEAFGHLTGVPALLNTSFNVAGEPIVETPEDALRCFGGTNIDVLVIEDTMISK